jgi:hypothetical protein
MTLQEKSNFHHALAAAYQEGCDAVNRARQNALSEAKLAVGGLIEVPGTCKNPGERLSGAAAMRKKAVEAAVDQIDQLSHHYDPGDDDDMPF